MIPSANWMDIGFFKLDAETTKAWWLGFVEGNRYTTMQNTSFNPNAETNCFYAVWGALDTYDQWVWNAQTMFDTPG